MPPASVIDFPHFCNESGHELVTQAVEGDVYTFTLKVKA
jgi:TusA-related sulfurtransferase